jgi:hypothetical protein
MRAATGNGKTPRAECGYMGPVSARLAPFAMSNYLEYITPFAVLAVAIVLVLGLVNMMRGGSPNRSQQLMRLRVILQFAAVVIGMAALYFASR